MSKIKLISVAAGVCFVSFLIVMIFSEEPPGWIHFIMTMGWVFLFWKQREERKIKKEEATHN